MAAIWRNPRFRSLVYQGLALGGIAILAGLAIANATANLRRRGVSTGFSFLANEAGIAIPETTLLPSSVGSVLSVMALVLAFLIARWLMGRLISDEVARGRFRLFLNIVSIITFILFGVAIIEWGAYDPSKPYIFALANGAVNTLKVAAVAGAGSIVFGFVLGSCQLSTNGLLSGIAKQLTEAIRNVPLLLIVLFAYATVINSLPPPRNGLGLGGIVFLSNRGIYYPQILSIGLPNCALAAALLGCGFWIRRRMSRRGILPAVVAGGLAVLVLCAGSTWSIPQLRGFNFAGGASLTPEYAALLGGLITYYSAFVADIVRSALRSVPEGQWEAAFALGLSRGRAIRLVVFPQAMRMITPPLANQILGLTKDTSIGVAIAFPELMATGRSIINQTGQSLEIMIIIMTSFVLINLTLSYAFDVMNRRYRIKEI